jgi:hypothetical protein
MRFSPWHHIGGITATVFVLFVFFGYYLCHGNDACVNPFTANIAGLSTQDVQSRLVRSDSLRQRRIARRAEPQAVGTLPSVPVVTQVPAQLPEGIILVAVGRDSVLEADRQRVLKALQVFPKGFDVKTKILVHYGSFGDENMGKGVRAFVTDYGRVMFVRSTDDPTAYFRSLKNDYFIEHEFIHVFQDQILSSSAKAILSSVFTAFRDRSLSVYGKTDNYEFLAENLLALYLLSREKFAEVAPDFSDLEKITSELNTDVKESRLKKSYTFPVPDVTRLN